MEPAPRVRGEELEKVWGDVARPAKIRLQRTKTVPYPARARVKDWARVAARDRAEVAALVRAAVKNSNGLTFMQTAGRPFSGLAGLASSKKEDNIMPGLDRSGPMGAGPMTGGRRGLCGAGSSAHVPHAHGGFDYGFGSGRGFGPGRGRGRGMGRGFCRYPRAYGFNYPLSATDEIDTLKADADYMKKSLDTINARIEELTKKNSA